MLIKYCISKIKKGKEEEAAPLATVLFSCFNDVYLKNTFRLIVVGLGIPAWNVDELDPSTLTHFSM